MTKTEEYCRVLQNLLDSKNFTLYRHYHDSVIRKLKLDKLFILQDEIKSKIDRCNFNTTMGYQKGISNIVVSLTCTPSRFWMMPFSLCSLFLQDMMPNRITLTLAREELSEEEKTVRSGIKNATVYPNLSKFYQSVLGIDAVTDNGVTDTGPGNSLNKSSLVTTRGAAVHLTQTYKRFASSDQARDSFVRKYTARKVPTMAEAMEYLGAKADGGIVPEEFAKFVATTEGSRKGRFDGKGYEDEKVLQYRRGIIDKYVELLKNKKGFRG